MGEKTLLGFIIKVLKWIGILTLGVLLGEFFDFKMFLIFMLLLIIVIMTGEEK